MYYQESYKCIMYKSNRELTENVDYYLANLYGDESEKITVASLAERLKIQIPVAKQYIDYYEQSRILERKYCILCPECKSPIRVVPADRVVSAIKEIQEMGECYNCDTKIHNISADDIYVVYSRVKMYTSSSEERRKTFEKFNEKLFNKQSNYDFFKDADLVDVEDIMKIYFSPSESAVNEMRRMVNGLDDDYETTTEKGSSLEDLVLYLFGQVHCFSATKIYRTDTNQLDVTVKSVINFCQPSILDTLKPYFVCECKNEKKKAGNTYYHKLYSILEQTGGKVGILFSIAKAAETCKSIAHDKYLGGKHIILINITKSDLEKIIFDGMNVFEVLKEKIDAVTLNSESRLKELGLDCLAK